MKATSQRIKIEMARAGVNARQLSELADFDYASLCQVVNKGTNQMQSVERITSGLNKALFLNGDPQLNPLQLIEVESEEYPVVAIVRV